MPQRVLVVDDEPSMRHLIRCVLADEGWFVATAANGREALDCLMLGGFDLVVLDLDMPVMDGRSFYREMVSRGELVPAVILSALGAMSAARELGAAAAIAKPFGLDEFVGLVNAVARRDQALDQVGG